jgi:hypothetical protein
LTVDASRDTILCNNHDDMQHYVTYSTTISRERQK